ncbi:hypothetical protein EOM89_09295 [Candidatus Falkowbacteria bacterium]|nr:hypothetical protein [Candidatus Falkowbacteria bacterium]
MKQTANERPYDETTHLLGKIWVWGMGLMLMMFPLAVCLYYGVWPDGAGLLKGLISIAPMYWAVGLIEVLTYVPMLGAGGSYLGFVTGSLTMLKVPCTLAALDRAQVKSGTPEGEAVATIAIAISSLVTITIIFLGVLLIVPLTPVLESETLKPAFDQLLPALFGGLGVALIGKNLKVAIAPIVAMIALFVAAPSLAGSAAIFVPVAAAIAILAARWMYKKGWLDENKPAAAKEGNA